MTTLIQFALFIIGCLIMFFTITEPTYEQLLQPIPFFGMILCLLGISLGLIISFVKWILKE